jgi:hypothetical protein
MSKLLSPTQVAAYERDGFVCPVPVLSAAEAQTARAELESWEAARGAPIDFPKNPSLTYCLTGRTSLRTTHAYSTRWRT